MTALEVGAWDERAFVPRSWEAAGWSEHGQTQRFLAVLRHLDLRAGDTVLDVGAGTGRLCEFLPLEIEYHAFDTSDRMLERVGIDHPRATVHAGELPDRLFDHVVAVGPFNLDAGWSREQTFTRLGELWTSHVRRSLVVSLYRGDDARCLRYDPMTVTMWAKVLGAHRFVVDASYLDNDLMLVLRK